MQKGCILSIAEMSVAEMSIGRNVRSRNVRGQNVLAETSVAEMAVAEMSEHHVFYRVYTISKLVWVGSLFFYGFSGS